jgi:hypothetical protein
MDIYTNIPMTKNKNYTPDGKQCVNCFIDLDYDNTRPCDIAQANYICKSCRKLRDKKRYFDKKEIIREQQRTYDFAVKLKIIEAYGSKCVCCGEETKEFLTIYHINNEKKPSVKLHLWLIKNNFPKDSYQLLCFNCNYAKGLFGYCPHNPPANIII